jgi:hypothetical protein
MTGRRPGRAANRRAGEGGTPRPPQYQCERPARVHLCGDPRANVAKRFARVQAAGVLAIGASLDIIYWTSSK